jgi:hypothetical protein
VRVELVEQPGVSEIRSWGAHERVAREPKMILTTATDDGRAPSQQRGHVSRRCDRCVILRWGAAQSASGSADVRFLGYNGTIINYLREVSVGGEGSGRARFANERDKAIEDDGRANMVPVKSDHGSTGSNAAAEIMGPSLAISL